MTIDIVISTSKLFKVNMFHCKKSCYQFPKLFLLHSEGKSRVICLNITLEDTYVDYVMWDAVLLDQCKYNPKLVIEGQHVARGNRQL